MEENPAHATQREQLKKEMDKLRRAMQSINDLELGANDAVEFDGLARDVMDVDTIGIEV